MSAYYEIKRLLDATMTASLSGVQQTSIVYPASDGEPVVTRLTSRSVSETVASKAERDRG